MLFDPRWEVAEPVGVEIELQGWQKILLGAINVLETNGWCQLNYIAGERRCAVGAMGAAANTHAVDSLVTAELALMSVIGGGSVARWNDAVGRTKEEVISALRKAITVG